MITVLAVATVVGWKRVAHYSNILHPCFNRVLAVSGMILVCGRVKYVDAAYTGSLYRGEVHSCSVLAVLFVHMLLSQVALHIAAVKNNHRIVRMLIASGASLNKPFANGEFFKSSSLHYGGTILGFACVNSDFTLFKMLIEAGERAAAVMIVPQP